MNYLNTNRPLLLFRQTLNDELYVDKSLMIDSISKCINNAARKYICITRPRRFGKTVNANMLGCQIRS